MPYHWDVDKRKYIMPSGKVVTTAQQRKIATDIVNKSAQVMNEIASRFVNGKSSFPEFAVSMREAVKNTHSSMAQFAYGGKSQMGNRQRGMLGATIKDQNAFLQGFFSDIEQKAVEGDGLVARAQLYGEAGWTSYQDSTKDREKDAGMSEERSFLEADADHCEECFDEAAKGWSPIDSLIPVGERTCMVRCQCDFEYR